MSDVEESALAAIRRDNQSMEAQNELLSNESEYYRAAVEQRAPLVVPVRVLLPRRVRGDGPYWTTFAEAGEHDCESNRWGALSVRATNGQMLGIRPEEFVPVAWRKNEKAGQP